MNNSLMMLLFHRPNRFFWGKKKSLSEIAEIALRHLVTWGHWFSVVIVMVQIKKSPAGEMRKHPQVGALMTKYLDKTGSGVCLVGWLGFLFQSIIKAHL